MHCVHCVHCVHRVHCAARGKDARELTCIQCFYDVSAAAQRLQVCTL